MVCERCYGSLYESIEGIEPKVGCTLCRGSGYICNECLAPLESDHSSWCDSCAPYLGEYIPEWQEAEDTGN